MNVLIVDDERLARNGLKQLLASHPDVHVIGECQNLSEALALCERARPDLLLLDIEMPGGDGFELLERLEHPPHVVFTTAFDAHAVRAFDVKALDYLLKPVAPARLAEALSRARDWMNRGVGGRPRHPTPTGCLERAFVRDGQRSFLVHFDEVVLLESEGNFTRLHIEGERSEPFLARSLSYLEERLRPERFFRANRRQLVNLDFVSRVDTEADQTLVFTLRDGRRVELSRRQSQLFRERLRA